MIPDDVLHEIKTAPDDLPMGVKIPPYCRGVDDERHRNRIAAFGALRRSVAFARDLDAAAALCTAAPRSAVEMRLEARAVRHAIRVAIGSDKR